MAENCCWSYKKVFIINMMKSSSAQRQIPPPTVWRMPRSTLSKAAFKSPPPRNGTHASSSIHIKVISHVRKKKDFPGGSDKKHTPKPSRDAIVFPNQQGADLTFFLLSGQWKLNDEYLRGWNRTFRLGWTRAVLTWSGTQTQWGTKQSVSFK